MKLGIIGAMDIEVDLLKERLAGMRVERHLGMEFCAGSLEGTDAVVVMCGIGKVNAALCTEVLISGFGVTHVVNTGVAGSLDARIDVGDFVVSTDAVHHDMDVTALGYVPGQVPDMDTLAFLADADLRARMMAAIGAAAPEVAVLEGRVASGDQFISSAAEKDRIVSTFGASCAEMEGASIAHACYLAEVPFVIVRAISDKADGSAHVDYPTFKVESARRSAAAVVEFARGFAAAL